MPRMVTGPERVRRGGRRLPSRVLEEGRLGEVAVGVDLLHVVELFDHVEQAQRLRGSLFVERCRDLRDHRKLGGGYLQSGLHERTTHFVEVCRAGDHFDVAFLGTNIIGACIDGEEGDLVGVTAVRLDVDQALRLELPGDGSGLAERSAVARKRLADLGDGAIAVVGDGLDEDGDAGRAVALEGDLLEDAPRRRGRRARRRA